jgi:hypothetical protein
MQTPADGRRVWRQRRCGDRVDVCHLGGVGVSLRREHRRPGVGPGVCDRRPHRPGGRRPQRTHRPADRTRHRLGAPPVRLPAVAQLGRRRGQALRGHAQALRRQVLVVQPDPNLRPSGRAGADRVAARAADRRRRRRGAGMGRLAGCGGVAGGLHLRDGGRRPAGPLQGQAGERGPGDGQGPVALHPPPQLLRRLHRVVGAVPRVARRRRLVGHHRADRDEHLPAAGVGRDHAGAHDHQASPRLRRLHRPHLDLLPQATQVAPDPQEHA